jgi:hypothetical protein
MRRVLVVAGVALAILAALAALVCWLHEAQVPFSEIR